MRLIDDGRKGRQNEWASLHETIFTVGIDFIPAVASAVADVLDYTAEPEVDTEWSDLLMSTTDLPDAFRGLPIAPADRRAAVVAVWHPRRREWMFTIMDGCPFGLGAVVVHFNRYPALLVAFARRIFSLLVAAYFDDFVHLEPQEAASSASEVILKLMGFFGTPPK